jgi:hypothetical protein
MLVIGDVELGVAVEKVSRFIEARLQAVSSRNMYSEHGLEARIGPDAGQVCQSFMVVLELDARIGAGPGGMADLLPQIARLDVLADLAVLAVDQVPRASFSTALAGSRR